MLSSISSVFTKNLLETFWEGVLKKISNKLNKLKGFTAHRQQL